MHCSRDVERSVYMKRGLLSGRGSVTDKCSVVPGLVEPENPHLTMRPECGYEAEGAGLSDSRASLP